MSSRRLCTTWCTYCCTKRSTFFRGFPMTTLFHASKISLLENKEQVIRFRVYGKSAASVKTKGEG